MNAQEKITNAFRELVLNQHYESFGVQDIIREASVARSTFYSHFRGKDHLLISSLQPILANLATLVNGTAEITPTQVVLEHIWENRQLGRVFFRAPVVNQLFQALSASLTDPQDPDCLFRMHGTLGILGKWCEGRVNMNAAELCEYLVSSTNQPP